MFTFVLLNDFSLAKISFRGFPTVRGIPLLWTHLQLVQAVDSLLRNNISLSLLWITFLIIGPLIEKLFRVLHHIGSWSLVDFTYPALRNLSLTPMLLLSVALLKLHPDLTIEFTPAYTMLVLGELLAMLSWQVFCDNSNCHSIEFARPPVLIAVTKAVSILSVLLVPIALFAPFMTVRLVESEWAAPVSIYEGVSILLQSPPHRSLGIAIAAFSLLFPVGKSVYLAVAVWNTSSNKYWVIDVLKNLGRWSAIDPLIVCVLAVVYSIFGGVLEIVPMLGFWCFIALVALNTIGYECMAKQAAASEFI